MIEIDDDESVNEDDESVDQHDESVDQYDESEAGGDEEVEDVEENGLSDNDPDVSESDSVSNGSSVGFAQQDEGLLASSSELYQLIEMEC